MGKGYSFLTKVFQGVAIPEWQKYNKEHGNQPPRRVFPDFTPDYKKLDKLVSRDMMKYMFKMSKEESKVFNKFQNVKDGYTIDKDKFNDWQNQLDVNKKNKILEKEI